MLSSSSFYNKIAERYDDYCEGSGIHSSITKEVALLESFNPSSILEVGIGTGRLAKVYLHKNPTVHYVGVDNSEEMIRRATNSQAILILSDIDDYLTELISEKKRFDVIIAPYSMLHHVETERQYMLFKKMTEVSNTIIINCLTSNEEVKLFTNDNNKAEITFLLPNKNNAKTTVHKIHQSIRDITKSFPESKEREYLIYT